MSTKTIKPKGPDPASFIERDRTYPNLWRVRYRDGNLSDIVNRARAIDAVRMLLGEGKL